MKAFAIVAFAAALPLLGACDERSSTPPPAPSANAAKPVPETVIGRSVEKAMDKARAKLATENISLSDFHVSGHHNGITVTTDEDPNDGRPPIGFNRCASSRSKRAIGASSVVPWIRTFATSRSHLERCASNASQLAKQCPAIAFFFT